MASTWRRNCEVKLFTALVLWLSRSEGGLGFAPAPLSRCATGGLGSRIPRCAQTRMSLRSSDTDDEEGPVRVVVSLLRANQLRTRPDMPVIGNSKQISPTKLFDSPNHPTGVANCNHSPKVQHTAW
jgi:hypothetical protein